jgi:WD40 repeat protein
MLPAEIEAAVVEPARRVGRTVERALAAELVGALVTEPTALPALQFVLYELAERDSNATLTLDAYHALGGIERAIAARAEELYLSLDDTDRQQVRELFERLVVVDADGEPTRRRASREELQASASVVDRWAASRLLTLDVHPQTRVPTVEVAHEALVREWPRLRQWIEEDRSELIVLGRLRDSAVTWADLDRDPSALLRGTALEAALAVAGSRPALAPLEAAYVDASRDARDLEQLQQDELIRRQARTNRRLRLQLGAIAVALVVALVGGLIALDQRQQAVRQGHVAVARELAAAAAANVRDDPELSILLALDAVDATRQYDEPVLPEAQEALHQAVASDRMLRSFPGVGGYLDWSGDGKLFATEGTEDTGIVNIQDAVTGRSVQTFKGDAVDLNDVVFSADSRRLITAGDEGSIRVWDVATGASIRDVTARNDGTAWGPSSSPDGRLVAGAWKDAGRVRVFSTSGGEPWVLDFGEDEHPMDTEFSPDGRRLAVATAASTLYIADIETHQAFRLASGDTYLRDLAWSPNGRWIATNGNDGAHVYDARTGRLLAVTTGHMGPVNTVAWSPDSRMVATGSEDGTARVYAFDKWVPREVARVAAQDQRAGVASLDFSPDGTQLMTSDWSITSVKVWDVRPEAAQEVVNIPGVNSADWGTPLTPDGRSVWVPEDDGHVSRYDLASGTRLQRLPRPRDLPDVQRLSLSPDGRLLVVADSRMPVPVWDTSTGQVAFVIGKGRSDDVSEIVWDGSGEHLAVGLNPYGTPSRVLVFDRTGAPVGRISGEDGITIRGLGFRGDGDVVATTGSAGRDEASDRGIRLWDWRQDKLLGRIDGNAIGVVFDPSGQHLATTRLIDGLADVWNASTGTHVTALEGHAGTIGDVAFDATGERVATASTDGSVRIWDARTGTQLLALRLAVPMGASSVSFSPDGTRLVTTWADGMTRVWTLDLDELIDIARSRVTRDLTSVECRRYLHVDSCTQS